MRRSPKPEKHSDSDSDITEKVNHDAFSRLRICASNIKPALPTLRIITATAPIIQSARRTEPTRGIIYDLLEALAKAAIFCQMSSFLATS